MTVARTSTPFVRPRTPTPHASYTVRFAAGNQAEIISQGTVESKAS